MIDCGFDSTRYLAPTPQAHPSRSAGGPLAVGYFGPLTPGGVAACSRWWSVFCDTTGYNSARNAPRRGASAPDPAAGTPSGVRVLNLTVPVVSQKTLHHRLQATTPSGVTGAKQPTNSRKVAGLAPCYDQRCDQQGVWGANREQDIRACVNSGKRASCCGVSRFAS